MQNPPSVPNPPSTHTKTLKYLCSSFLPLSPCSLHRRHQISEIATATATATARLLLTLTLTLTLTYLHTSSDDEVAGPQSRSVRRYLVSDRKVCFGAIRAVFSSEFQPRLEDIGCVWARLTPFRLLRLFLELQHTALASLIPLLCPPAQKEARSWYGSPMCLTLEEKGGFSVPIPLIPLLSHHTHTQAISPHVWFLRGPFAFTCISHPIPKRKPSAPPLCLLKMTSLPLPTSHIPPQTQATSPPI
jgi:hypothetical protein